MKLKKLIYSIAASSMIALVGVGSFSQSTVQASAKGHAVSKKTAYKYAYKTTKKIMKDGAPTKSGFKNFSEKFKHKHRYTLLSYQWGTQSELDFKISKINKKIHVGVSATAYYENEGKYRKVDASYYKQYGIKRHYTFKIKKHNHHKKSHINHNNKVTAHDIKSTNYYGKKAIGYYGFKHANGFWDMNRDLKRYVAMDHNFFPFWQAGNGAAYKVKGNYVHFDQSMLTTKKKSLIVKVSKVAKYSNTRGGKSMLKNIKTIGTAKELSKLTNE